MRSWVSDSERILGIVVICWLRSRNGTFLDARTSWISEAPVATEEGALAQSLVHMALRFVYSLHMSPHTSTNMVLLTVTRSSKAAISHVANLRSSKTGDDGDEAGHQLPLERLCGLEIGSPIDHDALIKLSSYLRRQDPEFGDDGHDWRIDCLLKGASVYQPPPPAKVEPVCILIIDKHYNVALTSLQTSEYKALMQRLRHEEEERQYERMISPQAQHETFGHISTAPRRTFDAATSIGQGPDAKEVDDVTFADVNRQMALIINVLVSIIACSVAIWIAARRWPVPQRLALSMSGSTLVAVAEVVIYLGYIRRIKDAKATEKKVVESKEIVQSWVLGSTSTGKRIEGTDGARFRKGKHR